MVKRSASDWRELFSLHEASGLSAAAFCREHGVCPKHFSVRKKQLGWSSSFVAVKALSKSASDEACAQVSDISIRVLEMRVPIKQLDDVLARVFK